MELSSDTVGLQLVWKQKIIQIGFLCEKNSYVYSITWFWQYYTNILELKIERIRWKHIYTFSPFSVAVITAKYGLFIIKFSNSQQHWFQTKSSSRHKIIQLLQSFSNIIKTGQCQTRHLVQFKSAWEIYRLRFSNKN